MPFEHHFGGYHVTFISLVAMCLLSTRKNSTPLHWCQVDIPCGNRTVNFASISFYDIINVIGTEAIGAFGLAKH